MTEQDKAWARVMVKLLAATGAKVRSEKMVNSDPDTRCSWIEDANGKGICDISNDCAALLTGPAKDREAAPLYTHPKEPVGVDLHTALRRVIFDTYMRMWSKTYPTKPDGTSDHEKMLDEVLAKMRDQGRIK